MPSKSITNLYPLSCAQEGFWILDQLNPRNPAFNTSAAFKLKGRLHRDAVEQSLDFLLARHESLRTTFPVSNGVPYQYVNKHAELGIEYIDLQNTPDKALDATVEEAVTNRIRQPFRLDQELLIRIWVIQVHPGESILVITQHNIISDCTSLELLLEELGICYSAFVTNQIPVLSELTLTYPDYSIQQRQKLDGRGYLRKLAYWKSHLQDCPALDLPMDGPRPRIQTFKGSSLKETYPQEKTGQLQNAATQNEVTLFMMLLAAFKVLLSKLTGQKDIVVGTPVSGRNQTETERMQGLFLNTLVLRTKFPEDGSFKALLTKIKEVALRAYAANIPFEKIIEEIQPERDPSRLPFFQVLINMFSESGQGLKMKELHVEKQSLAVDYTRLDIALYITHTSDGLGFTWTYNRDIFHRARIEEMASQYLHLLDQIIESPEEQIDNLILITQKTHESLENVPLSSNRTADRAALSEPEQTFLKTEESSYPKTTTEKKLVGILADVFHINAANMLNTFFEMGGHSLLAVQLLNRVRDTFRVELPLHFFFENPTIREMATMIEELQQNQYTKS
ncbi:MAG: condensation domain-containing protein [Arenicellales bacterium]